MKMSISDDGKVAESGRMDDVEDNSELRRGKPVAHMIYGIPQTINTANYVYFLAMQELIQMSQPGGVEMGLVTGMSFESLLSSRVALKLALLILAWG
jgi:geranylgeranyl diphosphate synthase type 3